MKDIQKHIILLFIFALAIVSFKAQNNFSSQEELKKHHCGRSQNGTSMMQICC